MVGLVVGIGVARLPWYRGDPALKVKNGRSLSQTALALSGYLILVVLAFGINLIPPVNKLMDSVQFTLQFPELITSLGFSTPAEPGRSINIFGHPGAILLYSSVLSYFIYKRAGLYKPGAARRILTRMTHGAVNSSLGIVAMVGMAVIMSHSGMTNLLAQGMSASFGAALYPAVAPFIGALGAFITGSNNNANVLFAALQMRTAELLGLSIPKILGAQTAGGSLGSVLAPAKVIVGCSTVGLGDNESAVMGKILYYGIVPVVIVAIAALVL